MIVFQSYYQYHPGSKSYFAQSTQKYPNVRYFSISAKKMNMNSDSKREVPQKFKISIYIVHWKKFYLQIKHSYLKNL